jgi:signal transduction histidine kinase
MLDTPADARFDHVAATTSRSVDVPVCFITLLDRDRQWMRAAHGHAISETPRDQSVCSYVVFEDAMVVIDDMATDPRTRDNFLVEGQTGPKYRFYAGAPVHAPNGLPMGGLCVLDTKPRSFSQDSRQGLADMAAIVSNMIGAWVDERTADRDRQLFIDGLNSSGTGLVIYDENDRLFFINHVHREIHPIFDKCATPGISIWDLHAGAYHMGAFPGVDIPLDEFLDRRCTRRLDKPFDTVRKLVNGKTARVVDSFTSTGGRVTSTTDITHMIEREEALAQALRELEDHKSHLEDLVQERTEQLEQALEAEKEINGLQRQFISMVSHEFRTPLAIMDGKARQIQRYADRNFEAEATEYVDQRAGAVRKSVTRLIALIECVLMASRMDEGKLDFNPVETDLVALMQEMCSNAAEYWHDRSFDMDIAQDLTSVVCDPTLMRQVVSNLLSNAGKYSDPGAHIFLSARRDWEAGEIRISVKDDGLGMAPEDLERLSERFFRAKSGVGRPGTGLGLNIVGRLVDMHGGRLEVESELDVGSTFHAIIRDDVEPASAAA